MSSLPTLFRAILTSLWAVIAPIAAKNPAKTALLIRIANHLNRTIQRFETLFARWQTNTLPKLRPNKPHPEKPHPEKPHPGRPHTAKTTPRLPRGPAWILRHVDHYNARGCASQLQHLLHAEDMAAFLAAFRNHGAFHEACSLDIAKRLVALLDPAWLRIGAYWYPRGGIPIDVFWQTGAPPAGIWIPDQGVPS